MCTPVNPSWYIKVGCNGVYIAWTCFHDEMSRFFVKMYFFSMCPNFLDKLFEYLKLCFNSFNNFNVIVILKMRSKTETVYQSVL